MPTFVLNSIKIALGPVLLVQGKRARATTLRLPEAEGPREGAHGEGAPLRLLVVGDSSAAGVGVAHQDQALLGQLVARISQKHSVDFGLQAQTGATTARTIERLHQAPTQTYDVAVVALGVNDVTSQAKLSDWLEDQHTLRALLRARFGVRHVFLSGVPPIGHFPALPLPLRWFLGRQGRIFDQSLRRDVDKDGAATFLPLDFFPRSTPMASDGFHPGPEIYSAWAERLAAKILATSSTF